MTLEEFLGLCSRAEPPAGMSQPLLSLWWDAHGDWDRAHLIAQEIHTAMGSLVHAYLHRKEGDQGNAG